MTYDHWKSTEPDDGFEPIEHDAPEFCIVHGLEHMKYDFGNPIPYCTECEREREEGGHDQ